MSIAAAADYGRMYGSGSASSMRTLGRGAWAIGTSVWAPLARRTASYWPHAGGARAPSRPEAQQRPSAHASLRPTWTQSTSHAVGTVRAHAGASATAVVAAVSARRRLWQWVGRWAQLWADARVANGARRRY